MEGYKTEEVDVVKVKKRNRSRKLGKQNGQREKKGKNERYIYKIEYIMKYHSKIMVE